MTTIYIKQGGTRMAPAQDLFLDVDTGTFSLIHGNQTVNAAGGGGGGSVSDASTTAPGIVEVDHAPSGAHPIALTTDGTSMPSGLLGTSGTKAAAGNDSRFSVADATTTTLGVVLTDVAPSGAHSVVLTKDGLPGLTVDARYAQFGNGNGQTIVHGLPGYTFFTLDYASHVGSDFALTLGDDHITIVEPGIYLGLASVLINDTVLGSGQIASNVDGPGLFSGCCPCVAEATGLGTALAYRLLVASSVPATVQFGAIQSDSIDHSLLVDAAIIRIGDVPA